MTEPKKPPRTDYEMPIGSVASEELRALGESIRSVIDAMLRMDDPPPQYVIATGQGFRLREFVDRAFHRVGISDWGRFEGAPVGEARTLVGNSRRLREATGWRPNIDLEQVVHEMVDFEMRRE